MLRALAARLAALLGRGGSDDADSTDADVSSDAGENADDEERSGFLPSRLDASVLSAHGMGTTEAERELAEMEEKAEMLDEHRRDR
jgi:hypothetical protein